MICLIKVFVICPQYVAKFILFKFGNYDKWLGGMQNLRANIIDQICTTTLEAMRKLV